jgi:pimeloyl-ACP methyl ester carboxylesterase
MNMLNYSITLNEKKVGFEKTWTEATTDQKTIYSEIQIQLVSPDNNILETNLESYIRHNFKKKYSVYSIKGKVHGQNIDIKLQYNDDQLLLGGSLVEVKVKPVVLLDNFITSHIQMLLDKWEGRKSLSFTAFIPQIMQQVVSKFEFKGRTLFQNSLCSFHFNRYDLYIGTNLIHAYTDSENRIQLYKIPSQNYVVSLGDFTELKDLSTMYQGDLYADRIIHVSQKINSSGCEIEAELTKPSMSIEKNGKRFLFISGSGKMDKDGQHQYVNIHLRSNEIACYLAGKGHLYLRYDDRGTGDNKNCPCKNTFIEEYTDALNAAVFLKSYHAPEYKRLCLIGHSSGGWTALKIARQLPEVSGVILLATPAKPLKELIVEQTKKLLSFNNLSEHEEKKILNRQEAFLEFVQGYSEKGNIPEPYKIYQQSIPWLCEAMKIDPTEEVKAVKCPILVLQGKKDVQVNYRHTEIYSAIFKDKPSELNQISIFDDLDHLFMPSEDGNIGRYFDQSRTISKVILSTIDQWQKKIG